MFGIAFYLTTVESFVASCFIDGHVDFMLFAKSH